MKFGIVYKSVMESVIGTGAISTSSLAIAPGVEVAPKKKKRPVRHRINRRVVAESVLAAFDTRTAFIYKIDQLFEDDGALINSKIDHAVSQSEVNSKNGQYQTSVFGLQDGAGNIIRVTVKREEANEFESALNSLLSKTDQPKEVAEILYMLKDEFEILDVDWAQPITEDEPVPGNDAPGGEDDLNLDGGEPAPEEGGEDDLNLDLGDEGDGGEDLGLDGGDVGGEPTPDLQANTVDLLQQVINLLKQETEARAANAELNKTKTQSEITNAEMEQQQREIDRQTEIAKVEQYEEKQREQQKHDKLIQRIAKFRATNGASDAT